MSRSFDELVSVMARLRAPGGCPWDAEQTYQSLSQYLLEEAYETFDAIHAAGETGDTTHLVEELGDLLLQVVFHSTIAAERGDFTIDDVAAGVAEELIEIGRAIRKDVALLHFLANADKRGARDGNRILVVEFLPLCLPCCRRERNHAVVADNLDVGDEAVEVSDRVRALGFALFEDFFNARETGRGTRSGRLSGPGEGPEDPRAPPDAGRRP